MLVVEKGDIAEQYQNYLTDESGLLGGDVEKLFFPETIADIAHIVNKAKEAGKRITISGARTGITGGAVPQSEYLVSLEKMKSIKRIQQQEDTFLITVEPGITLDDFASHVSDKIFDSAIPGADEFKAEQKDYFYPVDPTERTCSIGGTCATNASGARTYFYGPTRTYVHGLKIILYNGELLDIERGKYTYAESGIFSIIDSQGNECTVPLPSYTMPQVKHSAGYFAQNDMDLIDLFIGSEGTLGIIGEATLKVIPQEMELFSAIAFFKSDKNAIDFVINVREGDNVHPLALEFFDSNSLELLRNKKAQEGGSSKLKELPGYAQAAIYFEQGYITEEDLFEQMEYWDELLCACGSSMDNTWGGMEKHEIQLLRDFRHAVPESVNTIISQRKQHDSRIHKVGTDMSVPDDHLLDMYEIYLEKCNNSDLEYVIFGHVGNNHLHVNILPKTYEEVEKAEDLYIEFAKKAVDFGGSVAAEHGIGKIKRKFLPIMFGEKGIEEMIAVKKSLDPDGMFSPGNLF